MLLLLSETFIDANFVFKKFLPLNSSILSKTSLKNKNNRLQQFATSLLSFLVTVQHPLFKDNIWVA